MSSVLRIRAAAAALAAITLSAASADAGPEAHILRIDARPGIAAGAPVLTTLIEIVQTKRISDVARPCMPLTSDAALDCAADALEKRGALYIAFGFPEKNAVFTLSIDGVDEPLSFDASARFGDRKADPLVGTGWLVLVDASARMGPSFNDARSVASAFLGAMGPNDVADVMMLDDRGVALDTQWTSDKAAALAAVAGASRTYPAQGPSRPLLPTIKQAATDAFRDLGGSASKVKAPIHQAMVVLSNGASGRDQASNAAGAVQLGEYLSKGRFPEQAGAKTPVPVISIWFPGRSANPDAREVMEALSTPWIGGFFDIVRDGQAAARAQAIVGAVRERFDKMHVVTWRAPRADATKVLSFKLSFMNTTPPIAGDATFQGVFVGIDPTASPPSKRPAEPPPAEPPPAEPPPARVEPVKVYPVQPAAGRCGPCAIGSDRRSPRAALAAIEAMILGVLTLGARRVRRRDVPDQRIFVAARGSITLPCLYQPRGKHGVTRAVVRVERGLTFRSPLLGARSDVDPLRSLLGRPVAERRHRSHDDRR